ncbi:MAG TPA: ComF family protein [Nitrospiria bacterium]|nr:ComF family protein [Nitrospiria bacterium]
MRTGTKRSGLGLMLDLLLPTRCRICQRYFRGDANPCFCRDCWATVSRIEGPCCPRCGKPFASEAALSHSPGHLCGDCRRRLPHFDRAVAAAWYEGVLAEAIHLFKYRGKTLLVRPLGGLLLPAMERLSEADVLAPVPLHPSRLREREFNQALLLCDFIRAESGLPVLPDALERTRETPPQIGLSHQDRWRNVRRAFIPKRPERLEGRRIVLIDDVLTTGATVNDCARVLKRAGAERVCVLTVARTPDGPG